MTRPLTVDAVDATELGELLDYVADWFDQDLVAIEVLLEKFNQFDRATHQSGDMASMTAREDLVADLRRFAFLVSGHNPDKVFGEVQQ